MQLNAMKTMLNSKGIRINIEEDVKNYLIKNGYEPIYGARPINRIIRSKLLANLSKYLLNNDSVKDITASMNKKNIIFTPTKHKNVA